MAGRSLDWAQVYPEWGLAGNAAFIVAPREISRGVDLQRRVFLHSYDADVDTDGSALETILTAPLVVAQWINCQYYFSTVCPQVFGAGTKTIHNVVGTVGVIAGHTGDLQLGLPWQSVCDGERLLHEPMRLLAAVQAPLARIDTIIGSNPILQQLFGNDWVGPCRPREPRYALASLDPRGLAPLDRITKHPNSSRRGDGSMTAPALTKMTKVEVVVSGSDAPAVRDLIQSIGATGYTCCPGCPGSATTGIGKAGCCSTSRPPSS